MLNGADEELLERTLVKAIAGREIKRAKAVQLDFGHLSHIADQVAYKEAIRTEPLKADW